MLSATDVMWLMWHRQHEVMGKYLQRLSFSRAEIVLINSWMPVQQIVYHLLRVFMKTERLTDSMAVWLTEALCPHYFINKCNLLDSSFNLELIRSRLISISRSCLSSWVIDNYIRRCSQLCPRSVSRLFDDVSTTLNLLNAVSAVVDWRHNTYTARQQECIC